MALAWSVGQASAVCRGALSVLRALKCCRRSGGGQAACTLQSCTHLPQRQQLPLPLTFPAHSPGCRRATGRCPPSAGSDAERAQPALGPAALPSHSKSSSWRWQPLCRVEDDMGSGSPSACTRVRGPPHCGPRHESRDSDCAGGAAPRAVRALSDRPSQLPLGEGRAVERAAPFESARLPWAAGTAPRS